MNTEEIIAEGQKYLMNNVGRMGLAPVRGEGPYMWDADGNKYLDFVGGIAVNALGHCPPEVVQAMTEQAHNLIHCSNLYWIEPQVQLAKLLVENSALDKVFFCNSGAEANEAAIKLARKYSKLKYGEEKYEFITMQNSFHGRTLATVTATAQPKYHKGFEPMPAGFKYVPFNDLAAVQAAVTAHTCAVMLEPVQGEGGVNEADYEYIKQLAKFCQANNLLLIFDEVQSGMGRTGKLFSYEHYDVVPDIMTLAKALGSGFPIGATLCKEEVSIFQPGDHSSTFGGNPLACAVGIATIKTLIGGVVENAHQVGDYMKNKLLNLQNKYNIIKQVRGKGLILGVELSIAGKPIVDKCQELGLIINCTNGNVLRFIPPLNITKEHVDSAITTLQEVLSQI